MSELLQHVLMFFLEALGLEHLILVFFFYRLDVAFQEFVTGSLLSQLIIGLVELLLKVCDLLGDLLCV